jgi:hypothetical protein
MRLQHLRRIYTFARFGENSAASNNFRGFRWSLEPEPKGDDVEPKLGVSLRKMPYGDIYGEDVPMMMRYIAMFLSRAELEFRILLEYVVQYIDLLRRDNEAPQ